MVGVVVVRGTTRRVRVRVGVIVRGVLVLLGQVADPQEGEAAAEEEEVLRLCAWRSRRPHRRQAITSTRGVISRVVQILPYGWARLSWMKRGGRGMRGGKRGRWRGRGNISIISISNININNINNSSSSKERGRDREGNARGSGRGRGNERERGREKERGRRRGRGKWTERGGEGRVGLSFRSPPSTQAHHLLHHYSPSHQHQQVQSGPYLF